MLLFESYGVLLLNCSSFLQWLTLNHDRSVGPCVPQIKVKMALDLAWLKAHGNDCLLVRLLHLLEASFDGG